MDFRRRKGSLLLGLHGLGFHVRLVWYLSDGKIETRISVMVHICWKMSQDNAPKQRSARFYDDEDGIHGGLSLGPFEFLQVSPIRWRIHIISTEHLLCEFFRWVNTLQA